jgi:hypothetical protein
VRRPTRSAFRINCCRFRRTAACAARR